MPSVTRNPNRRSRPEKDNEAFRPHLRYPRLNANAGANDAAPGSRVRRQARRNATTPPKVRIRLDSSISAPSMRVRRRGAIGRERSALRIGGRWLSLLGLVGLVALIMWLFTSSSFHVSKVEIKGSRLLNAQDALKITGADKANIFLLSEDDVAKKLKTLPYVLDVKVSKSIPDKLVVELTERTSTVTWKVGDLDYLVDADGVVLDSALDKDLSAQAQAYTVIQSQEDRRLKIGDRVDQVAVRSAPIIQNELAQSGVKLAAIQYLPGSGLMAVSAPESGNWKALLGTDAQLEKKINILKGLLADKSIKWSYADLRFVNKPAIQ